MRRVWIVRDWAEEVCSFLKFSFELYCLARVSQASLMQKHALAFRFCCSARRSTAHQIPPPQKKHHKASPLALHRQMEDVNKSHLTFLFSIFASDFIAVTVKYWEICLNSTLRQSDLVLWFFHFWVWSCLPWRRGGKKYIFLHTEGTNVKTICSCYTPWMFWLFHVHTTHSPVSICAVFSPSILYCVEIYFLDVKCILLRAIE